MEAGLRLLIVITQIFGLSYCETFFVKASADGKNSSSYNYSLQLSEYLNGKISIPNSKWIFQCGKHTLPADGTIFLNNTHNITLTGDDSHKCSTLYFDKGGIVIYNSSNVSIQNLKLIFTRSTVVQNTALSDAEIKKICHDLLDNIENIPKTLPNYEYFRDIQGCFKVERFLVAYTKNIRLENITTRYLAIAIAFASGQYIINRSKFSSAAKSSYKNELSTWIKLYLNRGPLNFNFTKNEVYSPAWYGNAFFEINTYLPVGSEQMEINILGSTFQSPRAILLKYGGIPNITVNILGCKFIGSFHFFSHFGGGITLIIYPNFEKLSKKPTQDLLNIGKNNFSDFQCDTGCGLLIYYINSCCHKVPIKMTIVVRGNHFRNNSAAETGSVLYADEIPEPCESGFVSCKLLIVFQENEVLKNAEFFMSKLQLSPFSTNSASLSFVNLTNLRFQLGNGNKIVKNSESAVLLHDSFIEIHGDSLIMFNGKLREEHTFGGGLQLKGKSQLRFLNGTNLIISNNSVSNAGGGIFVDAKSKYPNCFFQFINSNGCFLSKTSLSELTVAVKLSHNFASLSGNDIYNTGRETCHLNTSFHNQENAEIVFNHVFQLPNESYHSISSDPTELCFCNQIDKNESYNIKCGTSMDKHFKYYPTDCYQHGFIAKGEKNSSVTALLFIKHVIQHKNPDYVSLAYQVSTLSHDICLEILKCRITHCSPNITEVVALGSVTERINGDTMWSVFLKESVLNLSHVVYSFCPPGFIRRTVAKHVCFGSLGVECICHEELIKQSISCNLSNGIVVYSAPKKYWIEAVEDQNGNGSSYFKFSPYCFPGLCRYHKSVTTLGSSYTDDQCEDNHTGTLCGECKSGFSSVLGSNQCSICKGHLLWLFPFVSFVLSGPLLVITLFCLNLTVKGGTINGFLFYVNILFIYSDIFFQPDSTASRIVDMLNFYMPGSWCFYDGMDQLEKSLLTFVVPLYLFLFLPLAGILPRFINMTKIHNLIGRRIVPVLATVILLGVAKVTTSVVNSLSLSVVTVLRDSSIESSYVWLFNGELKYFEGKHIIIGVIAVVFALLFLIPVTLVLTFGDLLRRCISNAWFVNFLDVIYGPFKKRLGWWVGMRLLIRIVCVIMQIYLDDNEILIALTIIMLTIFCIQIYFKPFRELQIQNLWKHERLSHICSVQTRGLLINLLDISFTVNLVIISGVSLYAEVTEQGSHVMKPLVAHLCISIALVEFLCIVVFHVCEYSPCPLPISTCVKAMVPVYRRIKNRTRFRERRHSLHTAEGYSITSVRESVAQYPFLQLMEIKLNSRHGDDNEGEDTDSGSSQSDEEHCSPHEPTPTLKEENNTI